MSPGQSIAHYRVTAKLGEGGMGAVYRATDTKLNREVAIKVLPSAFAEDAARMQRFEREAQVLAALHHSNIAAIYGIEQGALIMELVEGADLKGPVPIETAIAYARQIAAALEAAHEKGIIHRDLKPANIKVTPEGTVKLLDFGLAKVAQASACDPVNDTNSPTQSLATTGAGMTSTLKFPESVASSLRIPLPEVEARMRTELAGALYAQGILAFGKACELRRRRTCHPSRSYCAQ